MVVQINIIPEFSSFEKRANRIIVKLQQRGVSVVQRSIQKSQSHDITKSLYFKDSSLCSNIHSFIDDCDVKYFINMQYKNNKKKLTFLQLIKFCQFTQNINILYLLHLHYLLKWLLQEQVVCSCECETLCASYGLRGSAGSCVTCSLPSTGLPLLLLPSQDFRYEHILIQSIYSDTVPLLCKCL